MISFESRGSFRRTERYLKNLQNINIDGILNEAGREGVAALIANTPRDSGIAAQSWSYKITKTRNGVSITWLNRDVEDGFSVAVMIQYGYGTGTGGYVQGRDYINPAMRPIFDRISKKIERAVKSA